MTPVGSGASRDFGPEKTRAGTLKADRYESEMGVGDQRQVGLAISDGERARIVGRADDSGDRNDVP